MLNQNIYFTKVVLRTFILDKYFKKMCVLFINPYIANNMCDLSRIAWRKSFVNQFEVINHISCNQFGRPLYNGICLMIMCFRYVALHRRLAVLHILTSIDFYLRISKNPYSFYPLLFLFIQSIDYLVQTFRNFLWIFRYFFFLLIFFSYEKNVQSNHAIFAFNNFESGSDTNKYLFRMYM